MNYLDNFNRLRDYCESEGFKGWDPFDGLNSKILKAILPLKHSAILRLIVIQGFKRSPWNFRKAFMVPKQYNAKGIGLFLQGYCNLFRVADGIQEIGSKKEIEKRIHELAKLLIELRSKGYHGSCWGYNFDWQSRRLFLFKR